MPKPNSWTFWVIVCAFVFVTGSARQTHHPEHSWDYGELLGPSHWGDLNPQFASCKTGRQQSPIDIRSTQKSDLPPLRFDYQPSPLRIIDNGHTIMVNFRAESLISVAGKKYVLKQFHFHRPSEEQFNGQAFAMSIHLVHADLTGRLAVVAVLLQEGEENPLLNDLWKELPQQQEQEIRLDDMQIDPSRILPSDKGYYSFSGSLTTPPCTENVAWFVLKNPTTASAKQIERFSQRYPNNARPIQPLYDRIVLESR